MKIKSQDLRPGMIVSFQGSPKTRLLEVHICEEKPTPFTGIGKSQAYLPACVLVSWQAINGVGTYTFLIDEELERFFE